MASSLPDDIAERVRRLSRPQQEQAMAYVRSLERAAGPQSLLAFAGAIPPADLDEMTAAIETGCEQVDAADW
jgi:hypothetical protein